MIARTTDTVETARHSSLPENEDVVIIGGGLAGLAAAVALAPRGYQVTLLESRNRLGGRASSFRDSATDQLLDNCQHVSMGCCTNLAHFCRVVGIDGHLEKQQTLFFMTPDRKVSRFGSDRLPAPFHLSRSFLTAHYLSVTEKLRIACGLGFLQMTSAEVDPPFLDWLESHWQTPRTISRFWGLVLTSALNESVERVGLRYARKVFLDGFLRHRRGFEVEIPNVPLGELYGAKLMGWLAEHSVDVRLGERVESFSVSDNSVTELVLRSGQRLRPHWVVSALP
ncbi:MAG: FAD-dependent oxidoreductase, partial [Gemmataceae bacterium]